MSHRVGERRRDRKLVRGRCRCSLEARARSRARTAGCRRRHHRCVAAADAELGGCAVRPAARGSRSCRAAPNASALSPSPPNPRASSGHSAPSLLRPAREQDADPLVLQPAQGERQHARGGAIEPLLVVDCHEVAVPMRTAHAGRSELPEAAPGGRAAQASASPTNIAAASARRWGSGKSGQQVLGHLIEQIAEVRRTRAKRQARPARSREPGSRVGGRFRSHRATSVVLPIPASPPAQARPARRGRRRTVARSASVSSCLPSGPVRAAYKHAGSHDLHGLRRRVA